MTIKPSSIVSHLKTYLPVFSSLFNESISISSASISAGNVLSLSSTAHGMLPGQYILIAGGSISNTLIGTSLLENSVGFTTEYDHDLTKPHLPNDDHYLLLSGFSNVWDGAHIIGEVPNRRNFEISLPPGETVAPLLDGSQYLIEDLPAGVYLIASVPDNDTIVVDLSERRTLAEGPVNSINVVSGYRISAAADITRATDIYSQQASDTAYLFVIMGDTDVSKDRNTYNDSIAERTIKDGMLLRLLQRFSTVVFLPTSDEISGVIAQDKAYGEIFNALLKSLYGFYIEGSMHKAVSVPAGMGPGQYNSAYYTHVYDWQLPYIINFENAMPYQPDRALRDIDYNDGSLTVLPINTDEVPL